MKKKGAVKREHMHIIELAAASKLGNDTPKIKMQLTEAQKDRVDK